MIKRKKNKGKGGMLALTHWLGYTSRGGKLFAQSLRTGTGPAFPLYTTRPPREGPL